MKKAIMLLTIIVLIVFFSACESKQSNNDEDTSDTSENTAISLVDFESEELSRDEHVNKNIPEFSNVVFRCSRDNLVAVKDGVETTLISGMPIWNVFATDLNGDHKPELCATLSIGSGMIDQRVVVFDYANNKSYDISARLTHNFYLSMQDEKLIIKRVPRIKQDDNDSIIGSLSIKNQQLIVKYTNGETQKIDEYNPDENKRS